MSSCSPAAARNVSLAARVTLRPSLDRRYASLPIVVVFPDPLTPTTITTAGDPSGTCHGRSPSNALATSSATTSAGSIWGR